LFPALTILFDPNIEFSIVQTVSKSLQKVYGIKIKKIEQLDIKQRLKKACSEQKNQYNGQFLLNYLIDEKKQSWFILLVEEDLYVPGLNFIFGLASQFYGAVVSFHRLSTTEMKIKESVHECGHILGLGHCTNNCVMQFSNSLYEAHQKPVQLCAECTRNLEVRRTTFTFI